MGDLLSGSGDMGEMFKGLQNSEGGMDEKAMMSQIGGMTAKMMEGMKNVDEDRMEKMMSSFQEIMGTMFQGEEGGMAEMFAALGKQANEDEKESPVKGDGDGDGLEY